MDHTANRDSSGVGAFGRRAWAELGLDPTLLDRVHARERPVPLPSRLAVADLAWDCVAVASLALDHGGRTGGSSPRTDPVRLDPDRIATAYTSERHFRLDGKAVNPWAPMSGFWRTADGWVRTHANYPHHADRLRAVLGLPDSPDHATMERTVAMWRAVDLEEAAAQRGALASAVRTRAGWASTSQAEASRGGRWIHADTMGDATPRARREAAERSRPLAGMRVLDMTRVIAGPVAGRTLALAGADVLRVDPRALPEPEWQHLDTGHHKRSTLLDLRDRRDLRTFESLAAAADIMLLGYSPAALERLRLDPSSLPDRFPGVVAGYVSAWSPNGSWSRRRGFDSLVQAATGIAMAESSDGDRPGTMPAQALDHSTGYLLAAAVVAEWVRQRAEGGTRMVSLSLQDCAELLLSHSDADAGLAPDVPVLPEPGGSRVVELQARCGTVTTAAPAVTLGGRACSYEHAPTPWGSDTATWL